MITVGNTNIELVEFAKKALKDNYGYCLGAFCQVLTPAVYVQKLQQGYGVGAYNTKHKVYLNGFMNKRVTDCYGLVKGFLWWNNGNVQYNAKQDRNENGAYTAAKEKGPLSTMPEIPGLILHMTGHAGIYIGNGEFIECVGSPVGMRKGKIVNGKVTSGSKFTHWFKDDYIRYVEVDNMGKIFKDVDDNRWSAKYIEAANKLGIVTGDDKGNYNPTNNLTREEAAVIAVRTYEAITGKKVL